MIVYISASKNITCGSGKFRINNLLFHLKKHETHKNQGGEEIEEEPSMNMFKCYVELSSLL